MGHAMHAITKSNECVLNLMVKTQYAINIIKVFTVLDFMLI